MDQDDQHFTYFQSPASWLIQCTMFHWVVNFYNYCYSLFLNFFYWRQCTSTTMCLCNRKMLQYSNRYWAKLYLGTLSITSYFPMKLVLSTWPSISLYLGSWEGMDFLMVHTHKHTLSNHSLMFLVTYSTWNLGLPSGHYRPLGLCSTPDCSRPKTGSKVPSHLVQETFWGLPCTGPSWSYGASLTPSRTP